MRKILTLVIVALFLITVLTDTLYAGWKENYRTKYSKKTLDPNSERAKQIRTLGNFDFKYHKWQSGSKEGTSERTLTGQMMPWKKEDKDKFEGYTTNISPARSTLPQEEKTETGRTLTGYIKQVGGEVESEVNKALKIEKDEDIK